jgi:hypothetical protein
MEHFDNVNMTEYADEIFEYMRELEVNTWA